MGDGLDLISAAQPAGHRQQSRREPFLQRNRMYLWGVANAIQRMGLMPMQWRARLLRRLGCEIHPEAEVREDVFVGGPSLRIGRGCHINVGCFLDGSAPITVGDGVRFGPRVMVLTGTHSYQHSVMRRGPASRDIRLPVVIERGCWIGMGAMLMPGVVVAEGCVIAAGSVVLRSTQPNGMYAGNPARRVKDLPV